MQYDKAGYLLWPLWTICDWVAGAGVINTPPPPKIVSPCGQLVEGVFLSSVSSLLMTTPGHKQNAQYDTGSAAFRTIYTGALGLRVRKGGEDAA